MVKSLVAKLSTATSSLTAVVGGGATGPTQGVQETTTNYAKYRNDPGRFFGDGVKFKAKLIGILEVGEARGDRMCQEALQDLKMALRAAGEHKQRITIHVTIDGLRLRDEKTSDSLYHHPVHKISFIAQDMTDSRAFGYIFGSPDSGHRFFGIKTDKAASQVVLAMRDLFQVVFELKKKEIELARQQIQSKSLHDHTLSSLSSLKSLGVVGGGGGSGGLMHNDLSGGGSGGHTLGGSGGGLSLNRLGVGSDSRGGAAKELSPESVADLVDLEQELSSLQRGITQMERITPNEQKSTGRCSSSNTNEEDPFGDSFTNFPTYNLLPPPGTDRSRTKGNKVGSETATAPPLSTTTTTATGGSTSSALSALLSPAPMARALSQHAGHHAAPHYPAAATAPPLSASLSSAGASAAADDDDNWLHELDQHNDDVFDTSKAGVFELGMGFTAPSGSMSSRIVPAEVGGSSHAAMAPLAASESTVTPTQQLGEHQAAAGGAPVGAGGADFDSLASAAAAAAASATSMSAQTISTSAEASEKAANGLLETTSALPVKSDAFTDLDPLGTGRTRPYVDKKYFFQELKNPPKKVLRDLSGDNSFGGGGIGPSIDEFLSGEADGIGGGGFDQGSGGGGGVLFGQQPKQSLHLQQLLNATDGGALLTSTRTGTSSGLSAPVDGVVMLSRDTDPFSPTRKKSDPFQEGGDIFAQLDPFETSVGGVGDGPSERVATPQNSASGTDVFNGPLQVSLPPEEVAGLMGNGSAVRSRPVAGMMTASGVPSALPAAAGSATAFKQQTMDAVLSSISSKKMPHLFGQSRFTKRAGGGGNDSNGINMRRLQESGDSLSENEAAPEPPPRPDSASHAEPPPLPPKKQFNDIVIRPRITSGNALPPTNSVSMASSSAGSGSASARYELLGSGVKVATIASTDVPPIPLPSRRIGRSDGAYPGPGRPRKPGHTDDDYLAPLSAETAAKGMSGVVAGSTAAASCGLGSDVPPPLLPPPTQSSTRGRTQRQQSLSKPHDLYENKTEILQQQQQQQQHQELLQQQQRPGEGPPSGASNAPPHAILPDITLTQLLTLGIDELAAKLCVPTSKLSTMTLVELTSYLAEFIEQSKPKSAPEPAATATTTTTATERLRQMAPPTAAAPVFKVNFDQQSTFVAKFDDTFGEDMPGGGAGGGGGGGHFVANFAQFNDPPVTAPAAPPASSVAVPPADRYAVFREIIDQELCQAPDEVESADLLGSADVGPPAVAAATGSGSEMSLPPPATSSSSAVFEANFDADDFLATPPATAYRHGVTPPPLPPPASAIGGPRETAPPPLPPLPAKIDTKITEVVAQAKDRYAALRDIILVENLFDQAPAAQARAALNEPGGGLMPEFAEFGEEDFAEDQDLKQILGDRASSAGGMGSDRGGLVDSRNLPAEPSSSALTVQDDEDEDEDEEDEDAAADSSLDSNEKEEGLRRGGGSDGGSSIRARAQDRYEKLSTSNQQLDMDKSERSDCGLPPSMPAPLRPKQNGKFLTVGGAGLNQGGGSGSALSSSKDDLEIDELMQRAISNLSLDSRDHLSPATSANTPAIGASAAGGGGMERLNTPHQQFNDVSTSPIPLQKSPAPGSTLGGLNGSQVDVLLQPPPSRSGRPSAVSPQLAPLPVQLSAVSNLIDAATRQMNAAGGGGSAKDTWATFDSPKADIEERRPAAGHRGVLGNKIASLHLPPPPPSNASQNDTPNESPCSSDPRDEVGGGVAGWAKSVGTAGVCIGGGPGGGPAGRRWMKKERQQTSSSSRDLSPWDDELPDYQKQKRLVGPPSAGDHRHGGGGGGVGHSGHGGYYNRHTRRMNSCDEDYGYEDDLNSRRDRHCDRDGRKFKQILSRSRDNFDLESPSWYHGQYHGGAPGPLHHSWTPADVEKAAAMRASRTGFDRSAYERTTYGPPVYDKRGLGLPPPPSGSSGGGGGGGGGGSGVGGSGSYDKRKYARDYARPNYGGGGGEYGDEYGDSSPAVYRGGGGRAADYENVYGDAGGYKGRGGGDYIYGCEWTERKSFDRDSVESYESATAAARRRRSFGSGDVYGSLDSRDDFRERYIGGVGLEKTRSLSRKGLKLRAAPAGEIDYEQDSENDFVGGGGGGATGQRGVGSGGVGCRSLQRPSQLANVSTACVGGPPARLRKSSGSSPWDGDEPPLPGQKGSFPASSSVMPSWKRPSSAADSEQRRQQQQQQRSAYGQTPSGSDGEKDRRYRRKQRARGKDLPTSAGRYANYEYVGGGGGGGGFDRDRERERDRDRGEYAADDDDYADEDDYEDEPPTDEDKFERLNRRRREMHQRMLESERRPHGGQSQSYGPYGTGSSRTKFHTGGPGGGGGGAPRGDYHDEMYAHNTPTPPRSSASVSGSSAHHQQISGGGAPGSSVARSSSGGGGIGGGDGIGGGSGKFSFDGGFESDFNQSSPPPAPAGTASSCNSTPVAATTPGGSLSASATTTPATKSSFRFSNDFSEREKLQQAFGGHNNSTSVSSLQQFDLDGVPSPAAHSTPPIVTQKLRFDDNVKVSQFDAATTSAFEDDFSKAHFDFDKAEQWDAEPLSATSAAMPAALVPTTSMLAMKKQNLRNSRLQQRQDLIKKSESINIFAKKVEDPFEDDEFFQETPQGGGNGERRQAAGLNNGSAAKNRAGSETGGGGGVSAGEGDFQWDEDNNFAKFDENM